jgi:hypothetical protein
MEPISAQSLDLMKAVQALLIRQGTALEGAGLMALVGQDVDMLLQGSSPEGVKLSLPSGQTITAQGELPYPEGTLLRARVLPAVPGESVLRILLQEARPPAPPTLLTPLLQSEAQTLAARLDQPAPPPELAPLLKLLSVITDVPAASVQFGSEPLLSALNGLSDSLQASLGRILGTGSLASTKELASALSTWVQAQLPPSEYPKALAWGTASVTDPGRQEPTRLLLLLDRLIAQFQAIAQHPEVPAAHREALTAWIRTLIQRSSLEPPSSPKKAGASTLLEGAEGAARPATQEAAIPAKLALALQSHTGPKAELPETWESWIRGSVQSLTDPAISPREAPFHALQAKEGTAFFEIPLPWPQTGPLQIWVESDAQEERHAGGQDTTQRILMGLAFSRLGETRLGMAQGPFGLQIRIWTEHPEVLEAQRKRMEEDLKDLGKPVNLRIYALLGGPDGTIPSIRSLVTGPSVSALG